MSTGSQRAGAPQSPGEAKGVVCVSWIPELAATRELLLRQVGYQVTTILGKRELSRLSDITKSDLLVLAHSVPREEKLEALSVFRHHCQAPVLSLLRPYQAKLPGVEYGVEAFSPRAFLDAVASATGHTLTRYHVGCKNCDLIFNITSDMAALHGQQETVRLECPYCRTTSRYDGSELVQDPDPPPKF
jgi:CheY-like chemotaxis protein